MRGLGDPDAFPATDLGVLARRQAVRPARPTRAHSPNTAPVGDRGAPTRPNTCGPPSITRSTTGRHWPREGEMMEPLQVRTVDSPVGPLTLAGTNDRLTHLRMVDQTYEPSRAGVGARRRCLHRRGRAARRVLRRRVARLRPGARARRHRIPAARLGGAAHHPVRRDAVYGEIAEQIGSPRRRAPSVWPTATTRSGSSSRATGSSAPMGASPATAADWTERRACSKWRRIELPRWPRYSTDN